MTPTTIINRICDDAATAGTVNVIALRDNLRAGYEALWTQPNETLQDAFNGNGLGWYETTMTLHRNAAIQCNAMLFLLGITDEKEHLKIEAGKTVAWAQDGTCTVTGEYPVE